MTLLVDPPMLLGAGYAIGRAVPQEKTARMVGLGFATSVLAVSVATYGDTEVMRPVWTKLGAQTGRDLILNSWGILRFDPESRTPARRAVVAGLFASYPLWALLGVRWARRRHRAQQSPRAAG